MRDRIENIIEFICYMVVSITISLPFSLAGAGATWLYYKLFIPEPYYQTPFFSIKSLIGVLICSSFVLFGTWYSQTLVRRK